MQDLEIRLWAMLEGAPKDYGSGELDPRRKPLAASPAVFSI
jgi:hypothetical protein